MSSRGVERSQEANFTLAAFGEYPVGFSTSKDGWWIITSATLEVFCLGTYSRGINPGQRIWKPIKVHVLGFVDGKASVQSGPNHPVNNPRSGLSP